LPKHTLGEACRDHRIHGARPVGPFSDESTFSQLLRFSDDPARRGHKIVFTHADLNPRNILVDQIRQSDGNLYWSVTGIVDWETSGYYPEYWDYTKAMFEGFRWTWRYNDIMQGVFREFGDYSRELDVERRCWESGDAA
jgi:thiamine kinase-like enzyme